MRALVHQSRHHQLLEPSSADLLGDPGAPDEILEPASTVERFAKQHHCRPGANQLQRPFIGHQFAAVNYGRLLTALRAEAGRYPA